MESNFVRLVFFFKELHVNVELFLTNVYQSFTSLIKVSVLSKFNIRLPASKADECYILGNGPSLKPFLEKKELFKGKDLFCVNNFPSTQEYELLKPGNLLFLDQAFFSSSQERLPEQAKKVVAKTLESLILKTNWELNLFVPVLAQRSPSVIAQIRNNPNIKIYYYNYTIVKGFKNICHFLYRKNWGMPLCQNVLGACIFISLNMNYKKIYLLGADHTWLRDFMVGEDNNLYITHNHFYSNKEAPLVTKMENAQIKGRITMSKFLWACIRTFDVYYVLEDYAKERKSKIYNTTQGSYIDAFERVKII